MGRHTYESFGGRTLPGRTMHKISSSSLQCPNLETAIQNLQEINGKNSRIFLIGGWGLIQEALDKNLIRDLYYSYVDVGRVGNQYSEPLMQEMLDHPERFQWVNSGTLNALYNSPEIVLLRAETGTVFEHFVIP